MRNRSWYLCLPGVLVSALASGCNGGSGGIPFGSCGDYTVRSPQAGIDEAAEETCSSGQDSWGSWDLLGDGYAHLYLDGSSYDDSIGWFEIHLSFPNALLLEEGTVILPESAAGMYSWGTGEPFDWVEASSQVELTVKRIGSDYDEIWELAYFRLAWRGTWGDPLQGPYYTAEGEDWLGFFEAPDLRSP